MRTAAIVVPSDNAHRQHEHQQLKSDTNEIYLIQQHPEQQTERPVESDHEQEHDAHP